MDSNSIVIRRLEALEREGRMNKFIILNYKLINQYKVAEEVGNLLRDLGIVSTDNFKSEIITCVVQKFSKSSNKPIELKVMNHLKEQILSKLYDKEGGLKKLNIKRYGEEKKKYLRIEISKSEYMRKLERISYLISKELGKLEFLMAKSKGVKIILNGSGHTNKLLTLEEVFKLYPVVYDSILKLDNLPLGLYREIERMIDLWKTGRKRKNGDNADQPSKRCAIEAKDSGIY